MSNLLLVSGRACMFVELVSCRACFLSSQNYSKLLCFMRLSHSELVSMFLLWSVVFVSYLAYINVSPVELLQTYNVWVKVKNLVKSQVVELLG